VGHGDGDRLQHGPGDVATFDVDGIHASITITEAFGPKIYASVPITFDSTSPGMTLPSLLVIEGT
jgi:hypothetical protein